MQRLCISFLAGLTLLGSAPAQVEPLFGARQVALSPDGSQIAFVYFGDIWVASSGGGRAVPITQNIEMDETPVWSPDGTQIAFTTNRFGGRDIMVTSVEGGMPKRVTFHPGADNLSDWTPDGKGLFFNANREKAEGGVYRIDIATGQIREIALDFVALSGAVVSPDGKDLVAMRLGFPWYRPRYEGSAASDLVRIDLTSGARTTLRDNGFQHLWPQYGPDGAVYCVSVTDKTPSSRKVNEPAKKFTDSPARTPNVLRIDRNGGAKRLTDHVGDPVRWLSVARKSGDWAYVQGGQVHVARGGKAPQVIRLTANLDDRMNFSERRILNSGASEAALSPKGDIMAFVVNSEVWTVPVKKGKGPNKDDATQITAYEGLDQGILWHPNGEQLFFTSDRNDSLQLFVTQRGGDPKPVTQSGFDVIDAKLTPDKKAISYWQTGLQGGLYTIPVDGGTPTKVIDRPGDYRFGRDPDYDWSPDGRYVAYVRVVRTAQNIWIYDTVEKKEYNVTQLVGWHYSPRFSSDGKYLYIAGNRGADGIFAVPLQAESARAVDLTLEFKKPEGTPKVEIDFNRIHERIRRLTEIRPEWTLASDPEDGGLLFAFQGDLWKAKYDGSEPRRLTNGLGIGGFELNDDRKTVTIVRGGGIPALIDLRANGNPVTNIDFRADWTRDLRLERRAAFNQAWREYNRSFYDSNFHGRDWPSLKRRYEPYLSSVYHRNEMATVLNMMIGELESSHAEVGPAGGNPGTEPVAHLGLTFDYSHFGPGIKVQSVPPRSPGSFRQTQIKPGEFILRINGQAVELNEKLWAVLSRQAGRDIKLLVNSTPTEAGAREVTFRAMSGGEWGDLTYRNWVDRNRRMVDELSGGKVAYLHISGMGGSNFDMFNMEVWQEIQGRKAVIIDVRRNGGGNISDRLIDILERKPHSYYVDRDGEAELAPDRAWDLPTVVMHAESSFSNAEMFPYAMKQSRLATLVGMPTPGYVIWTYELGLVDGTSARMPTAGVYRMDGTPLENMGQRPDHEVPVTPEQYFRGEDPQIKKAVEEALKGRG